MYKKFIICFQIPDWPNIKQTTQGHIHWPENINADHVLPSLYLLPFTTSCDAMTNPNPSPGLRLNSTSIALEETTPLASTWLLDTAPRLEGAVRVHWAGPSSTPNQSRGSRVRVTGTESRKLVLWTRLGRSPQGEEGERVLWLGTAPSEEGEVRSGVPREGGGLL